jgi:hypothetical protein
MKGTLFYYKFSLILKELNFEKTNSIVVIQPSIKIITGELNISRRYVFSVHLN